MVEEILCVSYFDQIIGPNIFYCNEDITKDSFEYPDIKRILEFQDLEGSFMFAFRKYQTINYIFFIDSKYARGGKELIMLTYMMKAAFFKKEIEDVFSYLKSKKIILEEFAKKLCELKELPKVLHISKGALTEKTLISLGTHQFKDEFLELFNKYTRKLFFNRKKRIPFNIDPEFRKIFLIGAHKAGKKTFVKNIEEIQFRNQKSNNLATKIYEILVENIEIFNYNINEQNSELDGHQNEGYYSNGQGYILMLDLENHNLIDDAKEMYINVLKKCHENANGKIPILIIGNKFNGENGHNFKLLSESLNHKKLKDYNIKLKIAEMDVKHDDEKDMEAFRWLAQQII